MADPAEVAPTPHRGGRLLAYHWLPWIVLAAFAAFAEKTPNVRRLRIALPVLWVGLVTVASLLALVLLGVVLISRRA